MYRLSAKQLHRSFMEGTYSATQIIEYFLQRAKKFNPEIQAFLEILEERAIQQAHHLDEKKAHKRKLGKLAGVPIALKDNMHIKGHKTTCASKILANYTALFDATVTKLLEEEDAIIIGKTNLDEFAMGSSTENSAFFPTKNPWDVRLSPGGSSGGSAAAVASRIAPIGLGSDTGGSIRQPAALTGILGFKPSYGRVSRYGLVAFGSSLDQIGPLATNAEDIGLVMEVIGKHCENDSTSLSLPPETYDFSSLENLQGVKVGVPWSFLQDLSPSMKKNFQSSIKTLEDLGAEILDVPLDILKYALAVYYILGPAELSTNLARFDGIRYGHRSSRAKTLDELYSLSREEGFGPEVKRRIMLGTFVLSAGYQDAYYKKAQKVRSLIISAYEKAFMNCDTIAMPSAPGGAFPIGSIQDPMSMYLQDIFTVSGNIAGLPGISIPSGFDEENRPLSLQLTCPHLHDVSVVKYAYVFEKKTAFNKMIPPAFDRE
jgi:aspartyl-tRNA(Asn)/glutamyl-tRNA(Gln) amidotransferase subunit A